MKIIERAKVPKKKYGKVIFGNQNLEQHEISTVFRLASFGFDVETVPPTDIPNSNNPDLIMLGTYWEMKCPREINQTTLQQRFHKACKQSGGKVIFDLRRIDDKSGTIRDYLIKLFRSSRKVNHMIIIENEEKMLDILK